jgi:hypothetical protein
MVHGEPIKCLKCDKFVKTLKTCEAEECKNLMCLGCYPNAKEIGPKVCSEDCAQEVQNSHEQGAQVLEISMTKMQVSKEVNQQSKSIVDEYGRNKLPVGMAPRMMQLTTPKGKRMDFNAKEGQVRKKAQDELQRALAAVVGEEGIAGAPTGIGAQTIHFTVKETSAELWRCIQKGEIEIPVW